MLGTNLQIPERVSFSVVADRTGPYPQAQVELSMCEFHALKVMPGGVCLQNWMVMRGLLVPPHPEEDDEGDGD